MFAGQPFLFSKIQTSKKPLAMETAHPAQAAGSLRALRHGNIPAPVRDASVKGGLAQRVSSGQLDVSSKNWATRARSSGVEGSPCACSVNSGGDEHAPRRLSTHAQQDLHPFDYDDKENINPVSERPLVSVV